jgi:hypothetical protein
MLDTFLIASHVKHLMLPYRFSQPISTKCFSSLAWKDARSTPAIHMSIMSSSARMYSTADLTTLPYFRRLLVESAKTL